MYSMLKIGSLTCAAIAVAMTGIATHPSLAQQAQAVGFDLFAGGSVDLNPDAATQLVDAARKAQAPGDCPLGRIIIFTAEGDPLFQEALGAARRDAVLGLLNGQGIDPSRFFVELKVFGTEASRLDTNFRHFRDIEPPKLTVTSMPEKGKKVRANQRITVKAIASDDANDWQSGIKSIDLTSEGGVPFGFHDYPLTCERPTPPRTLEGVYTVPANPPPVVRLRATAKDFAGKETYLSADFPIGDWYGTIIKKMNGGGHNHTVTVSFAFDVDASGTIKGRANAEIRTEEGVVPGCTFLWTYAPSQFDFPISGRRDGENFEIMLEPPGTVNATVRACQESGTPAILNPVSYATTKYRIAAQEGATNTVNLSAGALPWGVIMSDTITIHQALQ